MEFFNFFKYDNLKLVYLKHIQTCHNRHAKTCHDKLLMSLQILLHFYVYCVCLWLILLNKKICILKKIATKWSQSFWNIKPRLLGRLLFLFIILAFSNSRQNPSAKNVILPF